VGLTLSQQIINLTEGGIPQIPPAVMNSFKKVLNKTAMQGVNWYMDQAVEDLDVLYSILNQFAAITHTDVQHGGKDALDRLDTLHGKLPDLRGRIDSAKEKVKEFRKSNNYKSMKRGLKVYFQIEVTKEDIAPYSFVDPNTESLNIKLAVSRTSGDSSNLQGMFKHGGDTPVVDIHLGDVFREFDYLSNLADRSIKATDVDLVIEGIKRICRRLDDVERIVVSGLASVFSTLEHELIHFLQFKTAHRIGLDRAEQGEREEKDRTKSRDSRGMLKQSHQDYLTSPIEYKPWLATTVNAYVHELDRMITHVGMKADYANIISMTRAFIHTSEFLAAYAKMNDPVKRKQVLLDFSVAVHKDPHYQKLTKDIKIGVLPLESLQNSAEQLMGVI